MSDLPPDVQHSAAAGAHQHVSRSAAGGATSQRVASGRREAETQGLWVACAAARRYGALLDFSPFFLHHHAV